MIKKLTLKNFKSFRESTIELGPLSIVLGANASGKSNFVDALRFLQGCARGLSLSEIFSGKWEGGQQVWMAIRGDESDALNLLEKAQSFAIRLDWEFPDSTASQVGVHEIEVERANEELLSITQERLAVGDLDYVSQRRLAVDLKRNTFFEAIEDFSILPELPQKSDAPPLVKQWADIYRRWISDVYFPSFTPSTMREYVSTKRSELGLRGENLSAIIFRMASDPKQRQTLLEWLRELCPQEIVDFNFIHTPLNEVLLAVKEPNGVTISARSMSDGSLRFLAIVVALLHAKEGSLFVLEDLDSDLHPSRLYLLVSFLEQVTASRRIQVIATSHSPYLLDHLSEQSLASVLVFARDHESQCTKVSKLVDIPGFAEARQHNPLDLLHASGWMEQNL